MPTAAHSLDCRLYRAGLALCPASFQREYAAQMAEDFAEALGEASSTSGRIALWRLRGEYGFDLVRTFGVQWTRSGLPLIGLAAVVVTVMLVETLATFVAKRATFVLPADLANADLIGLLILATVSVYIVASTICITLWATRPVRRMPRRRW
jgi:hypothetical protein